MAEVFKARNLYMNKSITTGLYITTNVYCTLRNVTCAEETPSPNTKLSGASYS